MNATQLNEQAVQHYFEAAGWQVDKLDKGVRSELSADFLICRNGYCFLCEVKTIESAQADFPHSDIEGLAIDERTRKRETLLHLIEANPDKQIILLPGEWERVFGDEEQYRKQYRGRRRYTEGEFSRFADDLRNYLQTTSRIKSLPYRVRLDSDDLYTPSRPERDAFKAMLEEQIEAISAGMPSWQWVVSRPPDYEVIYQRLGPDFTFQHYSTSYVLHTAQSENDVNHRISVLVTGPIKALAALEVAIFHYGVLNLAAIDQNIEKAARQLASSAQAIDRGTEMPRIVVVEIQGGFSFFEDEQRLSDHVGTLFEKHSGLSAIAIVDWVPDADAPDFGSDTAGVLQRMEWYAAVPWTMRYIVYHNPVPRECVVLDRSVFSDRWSIQR